MVEIARALGVRSRVLILDEPTSSLSEAETAALFATLRRLRGQGVGIIYISHRLEEMRRLADRITVLRDGQVIGTSDRSRRSIREPWCGGWWVATSRTISPVPPGSRGRRPWRSAGCCNSRVHDVSFALRRGEVLGFAGLVGAGRSELARALFGIDPLEAGEILVEGRPVTIRRPPRPAPPESCWCPRIASGRGW